MADDHNKHFYNSALPFSGPDVNNICQYPQMSRDQFHKLLNYALGVCVANPSGAIAHHTLSDKWRHLPLVGSFMRHFSLSQWLTNVREKNLEKISDMSKRMKLSR